MNHQQCICEIRLLLVKCLTNVLSLVYRILHSVAK